MIDDSADDPRGSRYDPLAGCPDLLATLGYPPRQTAREAQPPSWFRRYAARFTDRRTVIELPPRPRHASTSSRADGGEAGAAFHPGPNQQRLVAR